VKLLPQSAATAHGKTYLGVHRRSVVSSQAGASVHVQSGWSLEQAQSLAPQLPVIHSWQTIPAPHSASLVHAAGTHSFCVLTSQGSTSGHGPSGGQLGVAQPEVPTTWHSKPWSQSVLDAQSLASARPGAMSANSKAAEAVKGAGRKRS
jgi:hypothetical protein